MENLSMPSAAPEDFRHLLETNGVVVSICRYCCHMLAAKDPEALKMAEAAHYCPEKLASSSESGSVAVRQRS